MRGGRASRRRQAHRHAKVTAAAEFGDDRGREGVVLHQQDVELLDLDLVEHDGLLLLDLVRVRVGLGLELGLGLGLELGFGFGFGFGFGLGLELG